MPVYALGHSRPVIHPTVYVHPSAVIIGQVVLGAGVSIWPGAVLRGDFGQIVVGNQTCIQDNCVLHAGFGVQTVVGANCAIGHLAYLEACTIEDNVLIGAHASVLPGAIVRTGAMVAAGSVVLGKTEVPPGHRAQGVPARILEGSQPIDVLPGIREYQMMAERYRRELTEIKD